MNILPFNKKVEIVGMLVKGESLRTISQQTDVSVNAIKKLLFDVGQGCVRFHNDLISNLNSAPIQIREILLYKNRLQSKNENISECDIWGWIGIDVGQRLIVSWYVGERQPVEHQPSFNLPHNSAGKIQNLTYAAALHVVNHNCIEVDKIIKLTPAVAAGILNQPMHLEELVKLAT